MQEESIGDQKPVMFFIDFHVYLKIPVENIRPMPSEFKFPRYTVFAEIGG